MLAKPPIAIFTHFHHLQNSFDRLLRTTELHSRTSGDPSRRSAAPPPCADESVAFLDVSFLC
jgi:hypothetical protein